jgi:UDP-N-acetylglucosamine 2-epimerase
MLARIEAVLERERPDAVLVLGDTNSTVAGALAAAKLRLPVAHVEAGLRSFNRAMPEEVNRVITDHLATWLFAPSEHARRLLAREGITRGVHVVGDVMLDALRMHAAAIDRAGTPARLGLEPGTFFVATVHRGETTDDRARLAGVFAGLAALDRPVVLPLHPRTRKRLGEFGIRPAPPIRLVEPLGYLDMLALARAAACVLTDSGGVQREAYYLAVPCVTLRDETEWVETVEAGCNVLAGTDPGRIREAVRRVTGARLTVDRSSYGDGQAAGRIADRLSADAGGTA